MSERRMTVIMPSTVITNGRSRPMIANGGSGSRSGQTTDPDCGGNEPAPLAAKPLQLLTQTLRVGDDRSPIHRANRGFHGGAPGPGHMTTPGEHQMAGGLNLAHFQLPLPVGQLPALTIHQAHLKRSEAACAGIGGQRLQQLKGVRGAIGFDEQHLVRPPRRKGQDVEKFIPGFTTHTTTRNSRHLFGDVGKGRRVHGRVVIVVDDHPCGDVQSSL